MTRQFNVPHCKLCATQDREDPEHMKKEGGFMHAMGE